jgi:hypothetical protein
MTKLFVQLCMVARKGALTSSLAIPDMSDTANLEEAHTSTSGGAGHHGRVMNETEQLSHTETSPRGRESINWIGNVGGLPHMLPRLPAALQA